MAVGTLYAVYLAGQRTGATQPQERYWDSSHDTWMLVTDTLCITHDGASVNIKWTNRVSPQVCGC